MLNRARLALCAAAALCTFALPNRTRAQNTEIITLHKSGGAASPALTAETRGIAERVLTRRLGEDGMRRAANRPPAGDALTAWAAKWNTAGLLRDTATLAGRYVRASLDDALRRTMLYGSLPGGVSLEGTATGLGEITVVRYDTRFNAFIVNDRTVFFTPVPATSVAAFARSIGQSSTALLGVSGSESRVVYGGVPEESPLGWDLRIADHFLSELVFGSRDWTYGYHYANDYEPMADTTTAFTIAASFAFDDFAFHAVGSELRVASEAIEFRVTPILRKVAADSGFLPEIEVLSRGANAAGYVSNAEHLANNAQYYRRERIVDRMLAYGELTAFLRDVKHSGFDLVDLASRIPGANSATASGQ